MDFHIEVSYWMTGWLFYIYQRNRIMKENFDDSIISRLIFKKIFSGLTPQEEEILNQWLKEDHNKELYDKITDPGNILSVADKYDIHTSNDIYRKIERKISSPSHYLFKKVARIAAAIAIPVTVSLWLIFNNSHRDVSYSQICNNDSSPLMIVNNGEKMELSPANESNISKVGIAVKDTSGVLECKLLSNPVDNEETRTIEFITPASKRISIELPDGTKVMLNSSSKIRFPSRFTKEKREVFAEGELFFEVAPDKEHPFTVLMQDSKVTVLGTSFNVRAFPDEESISTTVCSGEVLFTTPQNNPVRLIPGEQSVLNTVSNLVEKRTVNTYDYVAWKEGKIYFNDKSLKEIFSSLKKWYGFDYVFDNSAAEEERFTIEVEGEESLEKIVELINNTNTVKIFIKNDLKVHIK